MMQDYLSAHDQKLASVVRLRRNADQQWGAVVARKRKLAEEWAAAAPARAAKNLRAHERIIRERARAPAPPPTHATHPRPAYVNRHLGHVGGKGPPQEAAAAPASPTRTPPRGLISPCATRDDDPASSDSESEIDGFSFDHHSVDELAAFEVVEVGMYLAPTTPNFGTYVDK